MMHVCEWESDFVQLINVFLFYLRFNNIEIVSIITLSNNNFASWYFALKHGIKNLIHLIEKEYFEWKKRKKKQWINECIYRPPILCDALRRNVRIYYTYLLRANAFSSIISFRAHSQHPPHNFSQPLVGCFQISRELSNNCSHKKKIKTSSSSSRKKRTALGSAKEEKTHNRGSKVGKQTLHEKMGSLSSTLEKLANHIP